MTTPVRKRRRRWLWISLLAVGLVLPVGCAIFSTEFKPAVDLPGMRAAGLASRFVDSPEGRVHYVVAGEATPAPARVLFIHGSPGTWEAWRPWLESEALRSRARLLAPDRIGFGGSARGKALGSLARQVQSLTAVLEAEPGAAAVVVGHSLGGPIAARLAMDRPELVAGLVLVAPSIDPALEKHRWYNVAGAMRVVQWFLPVDWTTSNRELWPLRGELEAMLPTWKKIACPVIVVQGEKDNLVPAANAEFAEAQMGQGIDVRRYPGMGHFLLWQKPETVTEPILELLR